MSTSIKTPDENPSNVESILSDMNGLPRYTIEPPGSRIETLLIMMDGAFASSIVASIDENFVMSITLKNNKGETIGTTQTIDLPLESVIVDGYYNSQTKELVFTLQNGNTIEISVTDLVSGLQTELSESNKLNPAYIDYDSTHAAITEAQVEQIETNKSNILSKCVVCTCSTESGTAAKVIDAPQGFVLQEGCIIGVKFSYSNTATNVTLNVGNTGAKSIYYANSVYTDRETKVTGFANYYIFYMYDGTNWVWLNYDYDGTYSTMTQDQASAGIDTIGRLVPAKVLSDTIDEKLVPVENNISSLDTEIDTVANLGAKNLLDLSNVVPTVPSGLTCTSNGDGTYTISGTLSSANSIKFAISAIEGNLILNGCPSGGGDSSYMQRITKNGTAVASTNDTGSGSYSFTMSGTGYELNFRFAAGTYTNVTFKPMLRPATISDPTYQPYALPNSDLTTLSAEDRASLVELVDSGAKNILDLTKATEVVKADELSYTLATDGTLTVTWTADLSSSGKTINFKGFPYKAGIYILSGAQLDGSSSAVRAEVREGSTSVVMDYGQPPTPFELPSNGYNYVIRVQAPAGSVTFKPMICTKADWDISQAYQPYLPPYRNFVYGTGTKIALNTDFNSLTTPGEFRVGSVADAQTMTNIPVPASGHLSVIGLNTEATTRIMQIFTPTWSSVSVLGDVYMRHLYADNSWTDWLLFISTVEGTISANDDLDNYITRGSFTCNNATTAASLSHCPYTASGFKLDVIFTSSQNFRKQIIQPNQMGTDSSRYERTYSTSSGNFSDWYKFEGTVVT